MVARCLHRRHLHNQPIRDSHPLRSAGMTMQGMREFGKRALPSLLRQQTPVDPEAALVGHRGNGEPTLDRADADARTAEQSVMAPAELGLMRLHGADRLGGAVDRVDSALGGPRMGAATTALD